MTAPRTMASTTHEMTAAATSAEEDPSNPTERSSPSRVALVRDARASKAVHHGQQPAAVEESWTSVAVDNAHDNDRRGTATHGVVASRSPGSAGRADADRTADELPDHWALLSAAAQLRGGVRLASCRTLDFLDEQAIPKRLRRTLRASFADALAGFECLEHAVVAHESFAAALRTVPGVGRTAARAVARALRDQRKLEAFLCSNERKLALAAVAVTIAVALTSAREETSTDDGGYEIPTFEAWVDRHEEAFNDLGFGAEQTSALLSEQLRQEIVRRRIAETEFLQVQPPMR